MRYTQSFCDEHSSLLSREVRVPMEGLLRKISTLRSEMILLLTPSSLVCEAKHERERERTREEESLLLDDFSPRGKDDCDRYTDMDLGYCVWGRPGQGLGSCSGPGSGPGSCSESRQGSKESKFLGLLPHWTSSLGDIKGQCESAIFRFNDISTLKDLHSGKIELATQTINPRQFFRDRFERFESMLNRKKINFEMVSDGEYENVFVRADPRLLGRAFESIFINAVDGTKEQGSIQVRIGEIVKFHLIIFLNVVNYLIIFCYARSDINDEGVEM